MLYILAEGLGTQSEAFDHGEVGEKLGREVLYRQTTADGKRHALDHLPGLGGYDLGAEQSPGRLFGNETDKALGVEVHQGARHVIERECPGPGVDPAALGGRNGQAYCCDLCERTASRSRPVYRSTRYPSVL